MALSVLGLVPARLAAGQSITFSKVVDSFDPFPDDPTTLFNIPGGDAGTPALNGDTVVFMVITANTAFPLLWAANLSDGSLTRLADQNTPIPDGQGTFINYSPFRTSAGNVVFRGNGGPGINNQAGLYVVPAQGGAIVTLANQDTPIPEGAGVFGTTAFQKFTVDGGNVVFDGIYGVPVGSGPVASITHHTFICEPGYFSGGMGIFSKPAVSGDTVTTVVFNVVGQTAVYTAPLSGIVGVEDPCAAPLLRASNVARIASLNMAVPGDPQGRNFDTGTIPFDIALIDGGNIVFEGGAGADLFGIYGLTPDGLVKLVDTNTPVPGGADNFQSFPGYPTQQAYTLSGGNVVFQGMDANGTQGLYLVPATGGDITKVIAVGDSLGDGRTVAGIGGHFFSAPIQAFSLSGTRLAFRVDFSDPNLGMGNGIYLAAIQ